MPVELLLPRVKAPVLPMPSYVKLAMAFGVGAGASLYDKSRYRSHGAITTATWAAGLHGYCLDFNPANPDYVTIPAAYAQLDFTAEDYSIIARIKLDAPLLPVFIFCRGTHSAHGYTFSVEAAGSVASNTSQALSRQDTRSAAGAIVAGNWYTVGVSRAGAVVRLYRNGVDVTFAPDVHVDPLSVAMVARVGIYQDLASWPLDGQMEFLRVFGGIALAASEHLAWHNALA